MINVWDDLLAKSGLAKSIGIGLGKMNESSKFEWLGIKTLALDWLNVKTQTLNYSKFTFIFIFEDSLFIVYAIILFQITSFNWCLTFRSWFHFFLPNHFSSSPFLHFLQILVVEQTSKDVCLVVRK